MQSRWKDTANTIDRRCKALSLNHAITQEGVAAIVSIIAKPPSACPPASWARATNARSKRAGGAMEFREQ